MHLNIQQKNLVPYFSTQTHFQLCINGEKSQDTKNSYESKNMQSPSISTPTTIANTNNSSEPVLSSHESQNFKNQFQSINEGTNSIKYLKIQKDVKMLLRLQKITPSMIYKKLKKSKRIKKMKSDKSKALKIMISQNYPRNSLQDISCYEPQIQTDFSNKKMEILREQIQELQYPSQDLPQVRQKIVKIDLTDIQNQRTTFEQNQELESYIRFESLIQQQQSQLESQKSQNAIQSMEIGFEDETLALLKLINLLNEKQNKQNDNFTLNNNIISKSNTDEINSFLNFIVNNNQTELMF